MVLSDTLLVSSSAQPFVSFHILLSLSLSLSLLVPAIVVFSRYGVTFRSYRHRLKGSPAISAVRTPNSTRLRAVTGSRLPCLRAAVC
ncbi:hypothetical protein Taro_041276 [Colocasia esculenta]|uniref:Uncharacterized protein n=1 Tax=Colocasia esculenta TaxID=4460 RepID=A0A843WT01_COLES|nr:hypothetical protein [Colocasia esculenta]